MRLEVAIERDTASPALEKIYSLLEDPSGLHAAMLPEMGRLTGRYIYENAPYRHETADRLGGTPTGAYERAAFTFASRSDAQSATLQFASPVLARAFRPVKIRPGPGKKFLTIPISGEAYGKTVREFERTIGDLFPIFGGNETSGVMVHREEGRKIGTAHYALTREVNQEQDRTLLPDDASYLDAARRGAITWIETELGEPTP